MKRKHPGKPKIYEDIDAEWCITWLVSIPMRVGKIEPIRVRVRQTEFGWRGWHVGGNPAAPVNHWYGHQWKKATAEESARLDAEYGTTTPINDVDESRVCDVTHPKDKSA